MSTTAIDTKQFYEAICGLIRRTSTDLPPDIREALARARSNEGGGVAENVLGSVLTNVELACNQTTPICQDTGFPSFYLHVPAGTRVGGLIDSIREAVVVMVKEAVLRPNAVDSITGENPGTCIGSGIPYFSIQEWDEDHIRVDLMLKGGGSENVSAQYSLPYGPLSAGRDLKGVEKVVLDAVYKAQGRGCSPGVVGVCIGSDRANGYADAKKALLTKLDVTNPDPELAALEERIVTKANQLGIGPMGFGGKSTLIGAKVVARYRHPASFFVSIAYNCWAFRRRAVTIRGDQVEYD